MLEHFCIRDAGRFIDSLLLSVTGHCTIDVIAFDEYLIEKYGEREISTSEFVREKFGLDAQTWIIKATEVI